MEGYTVTLTVDGAEYTKTYDSTIAPGERVKLDWISDYSTPAAGLLDCVVTLKSGDAETSSSVNTRFASQKVFFEEGTGMWCGWCVRGIVAVREAYAKYPDNFVAVTIHSNDRLETDNYKVGDVMSASGLPAGIINRTLNLDPNPQDVCTAVENSLAQQMEGALEVSNVYDSETNKVKIDASVWMNTFFSDGDYRLACLVMEDEVQHNGYEQSNAYAGGESGPMGGFENLPNPIPGSDIAFPDVARGALTDVKGEAGSVPSSMKAGEEAKWSGEFQLPANIVNYDKTKIIVALIDNRTKKVLNVQDMLLNGSSSVDELTAEGTELQIVVDGGEIRAHGAESLKVFGMNGMQIASGRDTVRPDYRGCAIIVAIGADGRVASKKVLL